MTSNFPTEIHTDGKTYTVSPLVYGGVPRARLSFSVTTPTGKVYTMTQREAGENCFVVQASGRKTPFTLAQVDGDRWTTTTIYNKADRFA
jgi:hypothetical protein